MERTNETWQQLTAEVDHDKIKFNFIVSFIPFSLLCSECVCRTLHIVRLDLPSIEQFFFSSFCFIAMKKFCISIWQVCFSARSSSSKCYKFIFSLCTGQSNIESHEFHYTYSIQYEMSYYKISFWLSSVLCKLGG